jgi:signal peptidase II
MNLIKYLKERKNSILKVENIYSLIFILLIFLLDRFSKVQIINNYNDKILFINNFINLDLIWNTGIGFGLLKSDSNIIYNIISSLIGIVISILFYISINSQKIEKFIFSIIIGGALGNFYDRVFFSAVPDFIDLHYGDFHWFTFNLADIFITIGIIIFLLKGLKIQNK